MPSGKGSNNSSQMTQADASRIQSGQAKSGGDMTSSGFAARAQAAGDRNAAAQGQSGNSASSGNTNKGK
ncbi:hypothetical protein MBLNU457_6158t1 [Dothideomycetes sp. NU457]